MAKTKKLLLEEQILKAVGAGKEEAIETVDFSDPNRPKTVLEVDFPILPINQVAAIEGNAGKPIYQMSKWWARRRSSVFRSMLLAAAMKAPEDPINAAKNLWDVYYSNHQKKGALSHLKVADIFMGGGTTLVEGSRLGMQMYGNDLNPIAWFVVKNELTKINISEVQKLADHVEKEVKPQIMPYYACGCPRGHKGQWLKFNSPDVPIKPFFDDQRIVEPTEKDIKKFSKSVSTFKGWKKWYETRCYQFEMMNKDFDPLLLSNEERPYYRYWGPEIIYTFWAKHAPCQSTGCGHRTPIMTTPVVSVKELSIKAWENFTCTSCQYQFDIEHKHVRMAPGQPLVIADTEQSFVVINEQGDFQCPSCSNVENISSLDHDEAKNKRVSLSLLVHPDWLKGSSSESESGILYGGSSEDSIDSTISWNSERTRLLKLIEVRGKLPEIITCPETGITFNTGQESCSNKGRGKFVCAYCGMQQQLTKSLSQTQKDAPVAPYAIHGYCPACEEDGEPYNGRFFDKVMEIPINRAISEWEGRKESDLKHYWPNNEIQFGHETHQRQDFNGHGYSHWWKMFNKRQLLVLSQLLKTIDLHQNSSWETKEALLGAFQQYLRNQNMFCIWNAQADKLEPHFSNNNYYPKSNFVENSVFSELGRGNWLSSLQALEKGIKWKDEPFEICATEYINEINSDLVGQIKSKSFKVNTNDPVIDDNVKITCGSSTELGELNESFDLIITDPPFGDNVQYAELADFFHVWMEKVLGKKYPDIFSSAYSPKALEAVTNRARHPENPDEFYERLLTGVWKESYRILKPGGILAFTFHHSEDEPWIAVLKSLFDAKFYLEATYPIRSDESKGEKAEFGSKKIEYDIIHVCRKRVEQPKPISWARLRRQMLRDIRQLQDILENHLASGLTESDLQVIKRGKALEYFSKHYGQVYVEEGREFTIREALIGINQLLDDENDTHTEAPPIEAEVLTRQFLRIFNQTTSVQRNEMQNYLRGTGVAASDFEVKNWCIEQNRVFTMVSPLDFATGWKGKTRKGLSYDLDQTLFLVGACYENSGINVQETLSNPNFSVHPAVGSLLKWFTRNGGNSEIKQAAIKAQQIYAAWQAKNHQKMTEQLTLFGMDEVD